MHDNPSATAAVLEPSSIEVAVEMLAAAWSRGEATVVGNDPSERPLEPARPIAIFSTRCLDQIVRVDRENSALVAQAGASVGAVREAADTVGLWCPALRWLPASTSIGAAVAGGHGRRARHYGAVADFLLGMRFACPAVGLVRHGGMAIKNATGYNLSAAVAGSRGNLGVIHEVILRLVPRPAQRAVQRVSFSDPGSLWHAARALSDPAFGAAAVEIAASLDDGRGYLLIESEDVARENVERRLAALTERARAVGGQAEHTADWPPFAIDRPNVHRRGSVEPTRLATVAAAIRDEARRQRAAGSILAEATGGALELDLAAVEPPKLHELLHAAGIHGRPAAARRFHSSLKIAFDPEGLLIAR